MAGQEDPIRYAITLLFSGIVLRYTGDCQKASDHLRIAHTLTRGTGQPWLHCASAVMAGVVEYDLGHLHGPKQWLDKGLSLSRAVGEPAILAYAISSLVQTTRAMGKLAEVERLLEEGLRLSAEAGHHFTRAMLFEQWAQLCFDTGDTIKAIAMGQESITIFRELNDMWHLSRALTMIGKFEMSSGDAVQGKESFIEAVEIALQDHLYPNAFEALVEIGAGLKNHGDLALALQLTQLILHHPATGKEVKERARQLRVEIESQLSQGKVEEILYGSGAQTCETLVQEILRRTRLELARIKLPE